MMDVPSSNPDYLTIFDSVPDPCLVLNPQFCIVAVNKAYLDATMTRREDILGHDIFAIFPDNPDDPAATGVRNLRASLERVVRSRRTDAMAVQKYDIRKPASEGGGFEVRYWSPINSPAFGPDGELIYIVHRVQDVTEFVHRRAKERGDCIGAEDLSEQVQAVRMDADSYNRAQEVASVNLALKRLNDELGDKNLKLQELNDRLSKIFNAAPSIIVITTLEEGRIIDVNEAGLQTLGYQRDEVIGRLQHEFKAWENESERDEVVQLLKDRRSVRNLALNFRTKSGALVNSLYSAELVDIDNTRCILSFIRDISERKRWEDALIRAKEEWERTFDSVPDFIAILDESNNVVRVNRALAEKLGRKPEECEGLACYAAFHGTDFPPDFCPHLKSVVASSRPLSEVYEMHMAGHFLVSNTPLVSAEGKTIGVVHVARDITDRKLAEEQIERLNAELAARAAELEAINKELETFNYTVAHDLRQPLNAIFGYCQAIEMFCGDSMDAQCRHFLQESHDGILRMNKLIDSLLKFARLSRVELRRETVDLSALAQIVAEELRKAEPQRAGCTFRIAEGITADGDPDLLRVVLDNLMGNAWKYTAAQPEALIEFGSVEREVGLAYFVRDNGAGFDMAEVGKLFEPFQRLTGAQEGRGFGIGLATVQRIIMRHGGKVWAEGEVGRGATFYFMLTAEEGSDG